MEGNYEHTETGAEEVAVVGDADAVGELSVTYEEFMEMAEYVREHLHDTVRENG
ncbi:MAG: hypothetical protein ACI9QA_000262, partial [Methanobacteriota archaeon]